MKRNKKAQISTMIFVTVFLFMIILVTAILAPFGVKFGVDMYRAGEDILESTNSTLEKINDTSVKSSLSSSVQGALDTTEDNIALNSALFKYSWLVVIVIFALIWFLKSREDVQGFSGGFR